MLYIMLFLKYLGSFGNDASLQKVGQAMVISKRAINDCVIRASQSILKLQKKVLRWPDDEEWKQIGSRIKQANWFCKITMLEMGWPGSINDNLVWLNSNVYLSKKCISATRSICLVIRHSWHLWLWLLLLKRVRMPP